VFLAGDLNLIHPAWQPGSSPNRQAEPFLQWTTEANLSLTIEPGAPTRGSNMLDHAWATKELVRIRVDTQVADRLYTSSDHKTLLTKISLPRHIRLRETTCCFRLDTMDEKCYSQTLEAYAPGLSRLSTLPCLPSKDQLDTLAQGITDALIAALEAFTKKATGKGTGQPWWTEDCRTAIAELRHAQQRDPSLLEAAKSNMRRVVRKAKQDYWQSQIANASGRKNIFRMVKWAYSTGTFHSPPLRDEEAGTAKTEPAKKRELLQQTLLQKAACKEDLPISWTSCPPPTLPFSETTAHEIQNSLLNTGNTTPGSDSVPTKALRKAWKHIQTPVEILFRACLRIG
jgi:hypothetical protein